MHAAAATINFMNNLRLFKIRLKIMNNLDIVNDYIITVYFPRKLLTIMIMFMSNLLNPFLSNGLWHVLMNWKSVSNFRDARCLFSFLFYF